MEATDIETQPSELKNLIEEKTMRDRRVQAQKIRELLLCWSRGRIQRGIVNFDFETLKGGMHS